MVVFYRNRLDTTSKVKFKIHQLQLISWNYEQFSISWQLATSMQESENQMPNFHYMIQLFWISCLSFELYSFYCVHNSTKSTVILPIGKSWRPLLFQCKLGRRGDSSKGKLFSLVGNTPRNNMWEEANKITVITTLLSWLCNKKKLQSFGIDLLGQYWLIWKDTNASLAISDLEDWKLVIALWPGMASVQNLYRFDRFDWPNHRYFDQSRNLITDMFFSPSVYR